MSISALVRSAVVARIVTIGCVFACLVVMSACPAQSLKGLDEGSNDPDMVYDARLLGAWPAVRESCTSTLTITAHDKGYLLQFLDCVDNKKTSYEAQLFKLDQHYFLDLTTPSAEVCELCIAIHLIYLVQFEKDSFALAPLDFDWLKQAVQKKTINLATLPDDTSMIISPAKVLKAFCRKYADNKEAFKPDPNSVFKRQKNEL